MVDYRMVVSRRGVVLDLAVGARAVRLVLALGLARPGLWAWRAGWWRLAGVRFGLAGVGVAWFDGGVRA